MTTEVSGRPSRLASPAAVLVLGGLVLALLVAGLPLGEMVHALNGPAGRLVPGRLGVRGDGRHGGLAPAAQPHGLDTAWRRRVHRPEQRCLVVHGARLPARSQASPRPGSAALAAQLGAGDHAFRAGHPAVPRWTGALA